MAITGGGGNLAQIDNGWERVAQGQGQDAQGITLDPGQTYRLSFVLPVNVPSWLGGMIREALNRAGFGSQVAVSGNTIVIVFNT